MTQDERREQRKSMILQAAAEEFISSGYEGVSMESICRNKGISKGTMYHYYRSKEELYLECVKMTLQALKKHMEENSADMQEQGSLESIKDYFFTMRECFFRLHPLHKAIFESAMFTPPRHLEEQIQELRAPLREMNKKFLNETLLQMDLRTGLDEKKAVRYLENMESIFWRMIVLEQEWKGEKNLHSMLETAGELLDMIFYGIVKQTDENRNMNEKEMTE